MVVSHPMAVSVFEKKWGGADKSSGSGVFRVAMRMPSYLAWPGEELLLGSRLPHGLSPL